GIRDDLVTGVQTCALPISRHDISFAVPRWHPPAARSARRRWKPQMKPVAQGFEASCPLYCIFSTWPSLHLKATAIVHEKHHSLRSEERRVGKECRTRRSGE